MFFYLYDSFLSDTKYEATCNKVEARLIELGINGRVERLSPIRNIKELLKAGLKQAAHTIVVVGNDDTFLRTLNIIADTDVALAYIPFDSKTGVAQLLGIPDTLEACNILSRRIVRNIPLLKVNQNYAFNTVSAEPLAASAEIVCDGDFTVSSDGQHHLRIANLDDVVLQDNDEDTKAKSEQFKTVTVELLRPSNRPKKQAPTVSSSFAAQTIKLKHSDSPVPIVLDGITTLKSPATITRVPNKMKVIVGKNRMIV